MNFSSLQLFECHMDQIKTQDWFKFRFIYNSSRMDIVQYTKSYGSDSDSFIIQGTWIRLRLVIESESYSFSFVDESSIPIQF